MGTDCCEYCHLPIPSSRRTRTAIPPAAAPVYCCYGCSLAAQITRSRGEHGQANWMLTRLGIAGVLTMGVMVFAMYLYGQELFNPSPGRSPISSQWVGLMRYACLFFATPVFLLLGLPVLSNAIDQRRAGVLSTDALVVLGIAAAFAYSLVSTLTDRGATYYETACMILVLLTLGRWLEATGKLKSSAAIEALEKLLPREVEVERDGAVLRLPPGELRVGDLVRCGAGQRIAVDGIIQRGSASIDEQLLTGESEWVVRGEGDLVRAGTLNQDGLLIIRAGAVGKDSALGRMIALLESVRRARGRFERLSDRISAAFIPLTLVLAAVGGVLGFSRGGAEDAILTPLAVLLIACPCAMGIATPLAVWVSLGHAAARGVLFRGGEMLERLATVRALAIDKTGTLTTGLPDVAAFTAADLVPRARSEVLSIAGALAARSDHPISRGIARFADASNGLPQDWSSVRTIPGQGIVATSPNGEIRLGHKSLMEQAGFELAPSLRAAMLDAERQAQSIALIGWAGHVRGVFAFSETLRPEARNALAELRGLGCGVEVLTGDQPHRAAVVAEALGAPVLAELRSEGKVARIRQLREAAGPVAMVGDGLNDAAPMMAADVGVAMGCGADVTREAAGVCLLGNDLRTLPFAVRLARRALRTMRINLAWAFIYNMVGIGLALSGRLSPVFAAAAMVVSSLFVLSNSMRLSRSLAADTSAARPPSGPRQAPADGLRPLEVTAEMAS